jgi:hypothetical protein
VIRAHTCYIPDCDDPDCTKPFDDEGYTPHFDSDEEAITRLVDEWGWTYTGGVLRCRDCTRRHQCEQTGHQWEDLSSPAMPLTREYCRNCPASRGMEVADAPSR